MRVERTSLCKRIADLHIDWRCADFSGQMKQNIRELKTSYYPLHSLSSFSQLAIPGSLFKCTTVIAGTQDHLTIFTHGNILSSSCPVPYTFQTPYLAHSGLNLEF